MKISFRIFFIILLVGCFILNAFSVNATTYYVDKNSLGGVCSDATSSPGNLTKPFCTITKANSKVVAGDMVYIRQGTYNNGIAPVTSGTSSSRIEYKNYPGEKPVISGISTGINLNGKFYITINGINTFNDTTFVDARGASYVWILNSALLNSTNIGGWPVGILMYNNARYNWIANCTIGNSGYQTATDDIGGVMNLGNWENPTDTTAYNLLESNIFFHGGHHVIELASSYNIIRNNTFYNEDWTYCNRSSTGYGCGNRNLILSRYELNANRNVIEGNRFAFSGNSIDDLAGSSGLSVRNPYNVVRRNLFYLDAGPGLHLYADSTTTSDSRDNYVYNNVFYKNGYSLASASEKRATFGLLFENAGGTQTPHFIVNVSVKNNLFYNDKGGSIFFYYTNESKQILQGNYYSFEYGSDSRGYYYPNISKGNIKSSANPLFVNISIPEIVRNINKFDFRLQAGSPCIDKGVFLTSVSSQNGTGYKFQVLDANYFMDGYGITNGDVIQLQNSQEKLRIVWINYSTNEIIVSKAVSWWKNQGVALAYEGNAPDIGAFETHSPSTLCNIADINYDGKVDGTDLAIWQQNYNPLGIPLCNSSNNFCNYADMNKNGLADGADLAIWQRNYDPIGIESCTRNMTGFNMQAIELNVSEPPVLNETTILIDDNLSITPIESNITDEIIILAPKIKLNPSSKKCTDNSDEFKAGCVKSVNAKGKIISSCDVCVNKKTVREYYCKNNVVDSKQIKCANGCKDGACR